MGSAASPGSNAPSRNTPGDAAACRLRHGDPDESAVGSPGSQTAAVGRRGGRGVRPFASQQLVKIGRERNARRHAIHRQSASGNFHPRAVSFLSGNRIRPEFVHQIGTVGEAGQHILACEARIVRQNVFFGLAGRQKFQDELDGQARSLDYRLSGRDFRIDLDALVDDILS